MIHPEVIVLAVIAVAALVAQRRYKRIPDTVTPKSGAAGESVAGLEARMARLEQAVDTIAIEMERIGESQRFLTKVLAERSAERKEIP